MAKRKAAKAAGRKSASTRAGTNRARSRAAGAARKSKSAARKRAVRRGAVRKSAARKGASRKKSAVRKSVARKSTARSKAAARKSVASKKGPAQKSVARKGTAPKKTAARKGVRKVAKSAAKRTTPRRHVGKTAAIAPARGARSARSRKKSPVTIASVRRAPALDRVRRTVSDDDLFLTPPSSLDLDRTASSTRTGRRELDEQYHDHTEASPALTAGDVDADWAGAYASGDEAPGGDNPTPDQDIVDEIGKALVVQSEDSEELKGAAKISDRDKNRWELDPASAGDYEER
jgi:hypothetical protein